MDFLYYYKNNKEENMIECFKILVDKKSLESIRIKIIEKYFEVKHYEFDTTYETAQECITKKDKYKNFNCTKVLADDKIIYHISYDKEIIPRLAKLIAELCINNDTSVIDEIFSFKSGLISSPTLKSEKIDINSYDEKTKYLEAVQKRIKQQENIQNDLSFSEEKIYFAIQNCIKFFPMFKLTIDDPIDTLETYKVLEQTLIQELNNIYKEDVRSSLDKKMRSQCDKIVKKRKLIK